MLCTCQGAAKLDERHRAKKGRVLKEKREAREREGEESARTGNSSWVAAS